MGNKKSNLRKYDLMTPQHQLSTEVTVIDDIFVCRTNGKLGLLGENVDLNGCPPLPQKYKNWSLAKLSDRKNQKVLGRNGFVFVTKDMNDDAKKVCKEFALGFGMGKELLNKTGFPVVAFKGYLTTQLEPKYAEYLVLMQKLDPDLGGKSKDWLDSEVKGMQKYAVNNQCKDFTEKVQCHWVGCDWQDNGNGNSCADYKLKIVDVGTYVKYEFVNYLASHKNADSIAFEEIQEDSVETEFRAKGDWRTTFMLLRQPDLLSSLDSKLNKVRWTRKEQLDHLEDANLALQDYYTREKNESSP